VRGMALLVGDGMGGHADADLHLLQRLFVAHYNARDNPWLWTVKTILDRLHVLKVLIHKLHKLLVLQVAGGANDQIAGSKSLIVETHHRFPLESLDTVLGTQ